MNNRKRSTTNKSKRVLYVIVIAKSETKRTKENTYYNKKREESLFRDMKLWRISDINLEIKRGNKLKYATFLFPWDLTFLGPFAALY